MPVATADLETVSTGLEASNVNGEPGFDCARSGNRRKTTAVTAGQGFSGVIASKPATTRRRAGTP